MPPTRWQIQRLKSQQRSQRTVSTPRPLSTELYTDSYSATKVFIDSYYPSLNDVKLRPNLASFYINPTPTSPVGPDISLNGNLVPSAQELQRLFELQMPKAHYEVQSYDCHVVNPNYNVGVPDHMLGPDSGGKKISIMVIAVCGMHSCFE